MIYLLKGIFLTISYDSFQVLIMSSSKLCSSAQSLADHVRGTQEYFETVVKVPSPKNA